MRLDEFAGSPIQVPQELFDPPKGSWILQMGVCFEGLGTSTRLWSISLLCRESLGVITWLLPYPTEPSRLPAHRTGPPPAPARPRHPSAPDRPSGEDPNVLELHCEDFSSATDGSNSSISEFGAPGRSSKGTPERGVLPRAGHEEKPGRNSFGVGGGLEVPRGLNARCFLERLRCVVCSRSSLSTSCEV